MIQFQIEALAKEIDYESALVSISKLINNDKLYVFENSEKLVVSWQQPPDSLLMGLLSAMYILLKSIGVWDMVLPIYIISVENISMKAMNSVHYL